MDLAKLISGLIGALNPENEISVDVVQRTIDLLVAAVLLVGGLHCTAIQFGKGPSGNQLALTGPLLTRLHLSRESLPQEEL